MQGFWILLILALAQIGSNAAVQIEPAVFKSLQQKSGVDVLISFKNSGVTEIRDRVQFQTFESKVDPIQSLYSALKKNADSTQAKVLRAVQTPSAFRTSTLKEVKQLWLTNQLIVKNADYEFLQQLSTMEEVASVEADRVIQLFNPYGGIGGNESEIGTKATVQWGVNNVGAPGAWQSGYRGQGVVVASIDTGVRGTHEALRNGFRQDHGWFDAIEGELKPLDEQGHGTHTVGSILGRSQGIGVAPEAQWIACRACKDDSCSFQGLLLCGQWVVCPTNAQGTDPRCDLKPHIVSNSWGGGQGQDYYDDIIKMWRTAGIVPIFASGNSGPDCGSINSPADSRRNDVISVGAIDQSNKVAFFSGRGPTLDGRVRPDIVAPGVFVYSATHETDRSYGYKSGTSMACPHASGVAALLLNKRPSATGHDILVALHHGAISTVPTNSNCGGTGENSYPNNVAGYGRISAPKSLQII